MIAPTLNTKRNPNLLAQLAGVDEQNVGMNIKPGTGQMPGQGQPPVQPLDLNRIVQHAMNPRLTVGGQMEQGPQGLDWLTAHDKTGGHSWEQPLNGQDFARAGQAARNVVDSQWHMPTKGANADGEHFTPFGTASVHQTQLGEKPAQSMMNGRPMGQELANMDASVGNPAMMEHLRNLDPGQQALFAQDRGYQSPWGVSAPSGQTSPQTAPPSPGWSVPRSPQSQPNPTSDLLLQQLAQSNQAPSPASTAPRPDVAQVSGAQGTFRAPFDPMHPTQIHGLDLMPKFPVPAQTVVQDTAASHANLDAFNKLFGKGAIQNQLPQPQTAPVDPGILVHLRGLMSGAPYHAAPSMSEKQRGKAFGTDWTNK